MPPFVRLLRPHQYAKNLLVFAAPGAAGRLGEGSVIGRSVLAFVLFCAVSSAGYILNDVLDVEADRQHPKKQFRPIASGQVTPNTALIAMAGIAAGAVGLAATLGAGFALTLVAYGAVSGIYSTFLKRVPWIELLVVSAGFLLRSIGGGVATDTSLSGWFLLVVSAGALLVITGKRLGELTALGGNAPSRSVLKTYRLPPLRLVAAAAAASAVGGYAAWAAAEANNQADGSSASLLLRLTTIPFALSIGRYLALSWRGEGETPESLIARDRVMAATGITWAVLYTLGRYL